MPSRVLAFSSPYVELNIAHRVRFLGYLPEVREVLGRMQLLVMPTMHFESFGIAAVEAMAMGLPVVVSDIRGCREVVVAGETGLLTALKDVEALVAAVARLLGDGDLRMAMGRAGRERVMEHYTEARTTQRVADCYRQCLEEGR